MDTLISTHSHADFDALASAVAAHKVYPNSIIVLPGLLNINVRNFLNLYRDFLPLVDAEYLAGEFKQVVLVDTRQPHRLKHISRFLEDPPEIHIYDHHPDHESDLKGSYEVVVSVGATTTLMVEEIQAGEIELTELETTILALGIYEDTGYLTFSNTTVRDVEALSYLWRQGINMEVMQEFLHRPLTEGQKTLYEKLISQSEFMEINQRKILFSWATSDEYIQGVAELVYRISSLEEAEAAFCLVSMDKKTLVVARSYQEDINLLDILAFWKVKGHPSAVSVTLNYEHIERARGELMEMLQLHLPYPLQARDIASYPVKTIDLQTQVSEASELLDSFGHTGLVVKEDDEIIGIISRKDLYKAQRHHLDHAPVKAFMSKEVITAPPEASINSLRRLMIDNNIGRVPLVGENGELVGIVTRKDILRSFYQIDTKKHEAHLGSEEGNKTPEHLSIEEKPMTQNIEEIEDLTLHISRELPRHLQKLLFIISQEADKRGFHVYLVGGSIRDILLGRTLPEDLDLTVVPDAIEFARILKDSLRGKLQEFEPFGTASISLRNNLRLDLVTARREFYLNPASPPQVEASSLRNDLFRRDFTINTLACSVNASSFGQVFDFFGGRHDLQHGIIRVLYQLSFVDDPLRILRAVRFEQRFGFQIEKETMGFLERALGNRILKRVSRGRLYTEVKLIFHEPDPPLILKRLEELGVLPYIFPQLQFDVAHSWDFLAQLRDLLQWAKNRDWKKAPDPEVTYLSALFYGLPSEKVKFWGFRMGYSREKIRRMCAVTEDLPEIMNTLEKEDLSPSELFKLLDTLPVEALLLMKLLGPTQEIRDYPQIYWEHLRQMRPCLDGDDLRKMGLPPGPVYGEILSKLKEAVMEGSIRSVEEEKNFVRSYLEEKKEDDHDSL